MDEQKSRALPAPGSPDAPKYWKDETGGHLARAMQTFLTMPERGELTVGDLGFIRAYIMQWIDSPVWEMNPNAGVKWVTELAELRLTARRILTTARLRGWLTRAIDAGVDPL